MARVLIITDIRSHAESLAEYLDRTSGIEVVGTARSVQAALALCHENAPEVALIDMATRWSLDVVRALAHQDPRVQVLALFPNTGQDVISWAKAGVVGYVSRETSLQDLCEAIQGAVRGELHRSPRIARELIAEVEQRVSNPPAHSASHSCLTRRELEVVHLIDLGKSNKDIAHELHISLATVKNHVHNILHKLGARRRSEAAAMVRSMANGTAPEPHGS